MYGPPRGQIEGLNAHKDRQIGEGCMSVFMEEKKNKIV